MKKSIMKVEGLRELDAALGDLPKATARNVLRRVLKKAAEPLRADMESRAPDDPSTPSPDLHSSIAVSTKLKNSVGKAEFRAVLQAGGTKAQAGAALRTARSGGSKAFAELYVGPGEGGAHGILQEFGTVHHKAQPFMRPAWDAGKDGVLESIKKDLGDEIVKSAKRLAKKRAKAAAKG